MNKPWYKHFWVWFVIAPPAASIVAGLSLLTIAYKNADDLVVDDYRKIGRTFEQQTDRDRVARELGAGAQLSINRESGEVVLRLTGEMWERPSASLPLLTLLAIHPTEADRDLNATLTRGDDGLYRGRFTKPPRDRRYLQLESADRSWRLTGTLAADEHATTL